MKKKSKNKEISPYIFTGEELITREELYRDVKKIYANKYDVKPIPVVKNRGKIKFDKKFLKEISDEEFWAALCLVTPPDKILTLEDVKNAENYLKTHKKFRENFKKGMEETKMNNL